MEIFVYRHGWDTVRTDFTTEDLVVFLKDKDVVIWVDFQNTEEAAQIAADEILNKVFHFHPLTIEDARETRNQPKVEAFADYLFFIVHGVKNETKSTNFVTKELDGYLGANFVVTYHTEAFRSIDKVKQNILSSTYSFQRGAAYLLHQILDEMVDMYMPIVDEFDVTINALEEKIFRMKKANDKILEEIMDVKRAVARLRRISTKQLDVLYKMSHGNFELIDESVRPFYRDVYDHLQRISDFAESYRDLVSGLLDIHFSVITNKTNEVMKVLAVFSAIMLPLSLIAGIYGMNFENMPELKTRYGYFIVIGTMFAVAIGLLYYFWRRGWIGQEDLEKIPDETDE